MHIVGSAPRIATYHLVHEHPKTPIIRSGVVPAIEDDFRRKVQRCATKGESLVHNHFCETKVHYNGVPFVVYQNIFWLQISIDDRCEKSKFKVRKWAEEQARAKPSERRTSTMHVTETLSNTSQVKHSFLL